MSNNNVNIEPVKHIEPVKVEEPVKELKPEPAKIEQPAAQIQQQQPQPQAAPVQQKQPLKVNKIASVKPPPPSTKIPKSAVVMPDGTTSSFNLDVQFGVDLEPLPSNTLY